MKNRDIYREWKQTKRVPGRSVDLTAKVMGCIHAYERSTEGKASSEYLIEIPVIASRLMRYAAALGLTLLGFYRIYSVAGNLLIP